MKLIHIINEIIELSEIGDYFGRNDISCQMFGLGNNAINFVNANKTKYFELIAIAFNSDPEIERTFTFKNYQTLFIKYFENFFLNRKSVKQADVIKFCNTLKSEKKMKFSVFRDLHGIDLKNPKKILKIGKYEIYDFLTHKKAIESRTNLKPEYFWSGNTPRHLIEYKVEARHFEKAIEIADLHFEKFELVLRYVIGKPISRFEVGILNYQGWSNRRAYILSEDGQPSISASNHGPTDLIPLDDPYFINDNLGYNYVWDLACANNLNKLQKRIILAVEWIGQSLAELSVQSAFLKSAIALEIIFTHNEKTIITPSILNQLSESVALILGKSVEDRLSIESKVKKLYGLRSKIVHSGNKNINESDYQSILSISRAVLCKLSTSDTLKNLDSIEKLYELLKKNKYSGCQI